MNLNPIDFVLNKKLWETKPPSFLSLTKDRHRVSDGPVYCKKTVFTSGLTMRMVTEKAVADWLGLREIYGDLLVLEEVVNALHGSGVFSGSEWCKTSIQCATVKKGGWVLCDGYSLEYQLPKPLGKQAYVDLYIKFGMGKSSKNPLLIISSHQSTKNGK